MPEVVIPDKYAEAVPRFVLPPEFSNDTPAPTPDATLPPAAPPTEAKPAAEAPAKPEPLATPEGETEPEKETTGKDPVSVEKRSTRSFERSIDRATRKAAEAVARAEAAERRAAELEAKQAPTQSGAPKMEDYTDIEEFRKAVVEHTRSETIKEQDKKLKEEAFKTEQDELTQSWESKVTKAVSKYEDFDEVVGDLKPDTPWKYALMQEENGADIAHYLATHEKEARRIHAIRNPLSQALEIGKLSVKLSQTPEAPKKPSKAPAPITPVTATAEVSDMTIKPDQPFEQYLKIGNAMFRGRRN